MKPFKAWLLYDATDTYAPTLHFSRALATSERVYLAFHRDAKWRVVRVIVSRVSNDKT